jgi:hypothetical protein
MRDVFRGYAAEPLSLDDYLADFEQRLWAIDRFDFWKLERRQHFREPGDASWEAFIRGDWEEALRLIRDRKALFRQRLDQAAERGFRYYRVRIVAEPLTPYLHWEMCLLRARSECGESIRVVDVAQIEPLETDGVIPEMATLGAGVAYRIRYESDALAGADRYTDAAVVQRCREFVERLHGKGTDLIGYFDQHVADLAPPRPA